MLILIQQQYNISHTYISHACSGVFPNAITRSYKPTSMLRMQIYQMNSNICCIMSFIETLVNKAETG